MLSSIKSLASAMTRQKLALYCSSRTMRCSIATSIVNHRPEPMEPIVDINVDDAKYDDIRESFAESAPLAPIDIDAWEDEDEVKQGTVDIDHTPKPLFEYPPIPIRRSGIYEFQGLKVVMPSTMMQNTATYRWRVDPEDQKSPDDMRICSFEPKSKE